GLNRSWPLKGVLVVAPRGDPLVNRDPLGGDRRCGYDIGQLVTTSANWLRHRPIGFSPASLVWHQSGGNAAAEVRRISDLRGRQAGLPGRDVITTRKIADEWKSPTRQRLGRSGTY
ncbi:MAG: hypothetical protein ACRDWG_14435, partial [Actinomycetes bacterium]